MSILTRIEGTAIGIDLGNKKSQACVRRDGRIVKEFLFPTDPESLETAFLGLARCPVLFEACGVSLWVSRALEKMGFEVIVADPRRIATEIRGKRKNDKRDARLLALLCERGHEFYHRIRHRSEKTMRGVTLLRARDTLVSQRTSLICKVKSICESSGVRIKASPEAFAKRACPQIPSDLFPILEPMLLIVQRLTEAIRGYDKDIERLAKKEYGVTSVLRRVHGVGPITSMMFVLLIEDPKKFRRNRQAGPYFGLVPRLNSSSTINPQLRVTKTGDPLMRKLLVQCAHLIMRSNAPDSDLKRFGEELAKRGGKNAKKRAVVAVARKLSVLLLSLWRNGEVYEPLRNAAPAAELETVTA